MTDETGRRKRFASSVAYFLPVAVLWLIAIMVFLLATPLGLALETEAVNESTPLTVIAGETESSFAQPVTVIVESDRPSDLLTLASGIVTSVNVSPGQRLKSGDTVLTVDDTPVVAQVGLSPITADVTPASTAANLKRLGEFLKLSKYLDKDAATGVYTAQLRTAINKWNRKIHRAADGTFSVYSIAFVSSRSSTIETLLIQPGARIAPDEAVARLSGAPNSITFSAAESEAGLTTLADGGLVFTAASKEFSDLRLQVDDQLMPSFVSFLDSAAETGLLQKESSEGRSTFQGGTLQLGAPVQSATLPSSAVLVSKKGTQCIFELQSAESAIDATVVVTLDPTSSAGLKSGSVSIPSMHAGKRFVANVSLLTAESADRCE